MQFTLNPISKQKAGKRAEEAKAKDSLAFSYLQQ